MKLEWTTPPPAAFYRGGNTFYTEVADLLRDRPGQWALVPRDFASVESAKNAAATIRAGRNKAMPPGEFEAVADGKTVYCRYRGGKGGDVVAIGGRHDPATVRAWAAKEGIVVGSQGRLPQSIIQKYEDAHKAKP